MDKVVHVDFKAKKRLEGPPEPYPFLVSGAQVFHCYCGHERFLIGDRGRAYCAACGTVYAVDSFRE